MTIQFFFYFLHFWAGVCEGRKPNIETLLCFRNVNILAPEQTSLDLLFLNYCVHDSKQTDRKKPSLQIKFLLVLDISKQILNFRLNLIFGPVEPYLIIFIHPWPSKNLKKKHKISISQTVWNKQIDEIGNYDLFNLWPLWLSDEIPRVCE